MYGHDGAGPTPSLYIGTTEPMMKNSANKKGRIQGWYKSLFFVVVYKHVTFVLPNRQKYFYT